jgi:chromosome segregation ATPase
MTTAATRQKLFAEIAELQAQVAQSNESASRASMTAATAVRERDESRRQLEESREHFGDMKIQLLEAEKTIARLEGYQQRVREDDNARDGFDVVEQNREVIIPRRSPGAGVPVHTIETSRAMDAYGRSTPRKHWTEY